MYDNHNWTICDFKIIIILCYKIISQSDVFIITGFDLVTLVFKIMKLRVSSNIMVMSQA
jgi:hypothetical protein